MDEAELRRHAVAFCDYAVNGAAGRGKTDDVYRLVTQSRHEHYDAAGRFYSSCGDLPHAMRELLGIREFVNRATRKLTAADPLGGWRWQKAENMEWLRAGVNRVARRMPENAVAAPGDILILDDGVDVPNLKNYGKTHTLVVLEQKDAQIRSADYGQPGGAIRERVLARRNGYLWLGDRRILSWLPLWDEWLASGQPRPMLIGEWAQRTGELLRESPTLPMVNLGTPEVKALETPYIDGPQATAVQRRLQKLGVDCGPVDGIAGPKTVQAALAWAWVELSRG